MSRICIITPGHLSTNPRVVKEAAALSGAGHEVKVISGRFSAWGIEADRRFDMSAWTSAAQVRFGPLAPMAVRLRQRLVRTLARASARLAPGSRLAALALHDVSGDLMTAARRTPADLYIAHYDSALAAAAAGAARHGGVYAFDAEDFHPGDLPDEPRHAFENRLIKAVERRHLPGCAYMTAASPGIAKAYADAYGLAEPRIILNVFSRTEGSASPTSHGSTLPGPSFYWFSQTIGPDRGLEWAIQAIAVARSQPHLYLRGTLASGYGEEIRALAARLDVTERVHVLAPLPPDELVGQMSEFDVGYVGETGATPNHRIAMANKLFSCLVAGVPILASDIPAHRALVDDCQGCLTLFPLGDHHQLAAALDALLLDPDRLAASRAKAWRLGQERFNWEIEQQGLIDIVHQALARRGRA